MSAQAAPSLPRAIDLRSDTVTRPGPDMRRVMAEAEVGDDVLGDDPTVLALQTKVAKLLGKERALFVPSGTMANQIAIRSHTEAGDEIIFHEHAHIFLFETGALGGICGVQGRGLPGARGLLNPDDVERAVRPKESHFPPSKLLCIENTHNYGGGSVYPLDLVQRLSETAHGLGLRVHMDGARLWNACAAADHAPDEYARHCESVSVCLSKGLGAPVGSILAGSAEFIGRAHRFRKMFGGAMRQAGVLAAAGIFALDHHLDRIKEDHANAKYFAQKLSQIPGVRIDVEAVETNLVFFGMEGRTPAWIEAELHKRGVWLFAERPTEVRAVMHLDVSREDLDRALKIISEMAGQ